jgi:antitoxin component YwqK of YwqJK toxin-antitoxin module
MNYKKLAVLIEGTSNSGKTSTIRRLIFCLTLIIHFFPCLAQNNKNLPEWTRSDEIIKIHDDTTYYRSGGIKVIAIFHEKQIDDNYNVLVTVGSKKKYYRNKQIKHVEVYDNYGAFLSKDRYYRNGNLKGQVFSDTTSPQIVFSKTHFEYEIIYLKDYRRDGTIMREGRWKNYLRYGKWIFYDRQGHIKKTKQY